MYTYKYPRPAVTTDAVVFAKEDDNLYVLLIKRGRPPFQGMWALPGGFLDIDEELDDGVKRELQEETGLTDVELKQFHTYGAIGRDPRHRTISVAFVGMIDGLKNVKGADDATDARWFPVNDLPPLAFDHSNIINDALKYIKKH
ncbi:MAG: NUDIX hydrolase [Chlorobi bacterium]|nr:NUDIX hydrolase [Chlorobiota bacterium]